MSDNKNYTFFPYSPAITTIAVPYELLVPAIAYLRNQGACQSGISKCLVSGAGEWDGVKFAVPQFGDDSPELDALLSQVPDWDECRDEWDEDEECCTCGDCHAAYNSYMANASVEVREYITQLGANIHTNSRAHAQYNFRYRSTTSPIKNAWSAENIKPNFPGVRSDDFATPPRAWLAAELLRHLVPGVQIDVQPSGANIVDLTLVHCTELVGLCMVGDKLVVSHALFSVFDNLSFRGGRVLNIDAETRAVLSSDPTRVHITPGGAEVPTT